MFFLDRAWMDLASPQGLKATGTDQKVLSHNSPLSLGLKNPKNIFKNHFF